MQWKNLQNLHYSRKFVICILLKDGIYQTSHNSNGLGKTNTNDECVESPVHLLVEQLD